MYGALHASTFHLPEQVILFGFFVPWILSLFGFLACKLLSLNDALGPLVTLSWWLLWTALYTFGVLRPKLIQLFYNPLWRRCASQH